jgi:N-acetylneuraminate synthase
MFAAGEPFSAANIWVKRPGTGEIKARDYERVLGRRAARAIPHNTQVRWIDVS